MCNWISAIIVEKGKKALWHPDIDSHTGLLEHFKISDKTDKPKFVRVEFSPKDSDFFNHDFKKWTFKTDQDFRPDWYDEDAAKALMLTTAKTITKERFLSGKIKELKEGRWFLKDAELEKASGTAFLAQVRNSKVGVLWGNSQVGVLWGNSKVGELWGNSKVLRHSSTNKTTKINDQSMIVYPEEKKIVMVDPAYQLEILKAIKI